MISADWLLMGGKAGRSQLSWFTVYVMEASGGGYSRKAHV